MPSFPPEAWRLVREVFEAALAQPTERRRTFVAESCRDEPAIHDQVVALLASHDDAEGFLESSPATLLRRLAHENRAIDDDTEPNIGRVIGPYAIQSCIGHGGMGAVYLARRADRAFERRVAIKMIRRGMDSEAVVRRFQHERQILASLEHPNIGQLLDGGTTEDGVPYLVMELVEGSPIDQYCDEHRLPVTDRLRLFRQVCEAVQYAHQRLIIHRDLKPSNVLVATGGVPKLLDFGIAKLLDQAPGAETTLVRPMTPAYASPEQVRGEPITTASDVYSLGVLLYHLLTGRSPYPGAARSSLELVRAVCDTEPSRPSTVAMREPSIHEEDAEKSLTPEELSRTREGSPVKLRRRLAGDLDDIVLKALRKEPQQRYASVEQLSEDIRRHLERLPVTARRGSSRYRAGKFIARHTFGVAAAAVVLLAVLSGTAATAWQARIARQQAEIARSERARAERRFNEVRQLANTMILGVHDAVVPLAGSTPVRKMIVAEALKYLERLEGESAGDHDLQIELARAYARIGSVQGNLAGPHLGESADAVRSYERALNLLRTVANHTNSFESSVALADINLGLSVVVASSDSPRAQTSAREALAIGEALLARGPGSPEATRVVAAASLALGKYYEPVEADPFLRRAAALYTELAAAGSGDATLLQELATVEGVLGGNYQVLGEHAKALPHHERARELAERQLALEPGNRNALSQLAAALGNIGAVFMRGTPKAPDRAVPLLERALRIRRELADADPQNLHAQRSVGWTLVPLGYGHTSLGNRSAAEKYLWEAVERDTRFPSPSAVGFYLQFGSAWLALADLHAGRGERGTACAGYRRSIQFFTTATRVGGDAICWSIRPIG